jgi:hypothetical protein
LKLKSFAPSFNATVTSLLTLFVLPAIYRWFDPPELIP